MIIKAHTNIVPINTQAKNSIFVRDTYSFNIFFKNKQKIISCATQTQLMEQYLLFEYLLVNTQNRARVEDKTKRLGAKWILIIVLKVREVSVILKITAKVSLYLSRTSGGSVKFTLPFEQ